MSEQAKLTELKEVSLSDSCNQLVKIIRDVGEKLDEKKREQVSKDIENIISFITVSLSDNVDTNNFSTNQKDKSQCNDRMDFEQQNDNESTINKQDINILLLGETGVGKSTFINAFYNYLTFGTLDDALKDRELKALIPSTFFYTDNNYNSHEIKIVKNLDVGNDDGIDAEKNEVYVPGQSVTQHAKAYQFTTPDGQLIRIIDTPGIGDSGGIKVDQENFKNTIEYLSQFDHLNAICILLKPNVKRIELQTRYCIKELFSHLNKTSIQNLIFCFTNTRATTFRPGETYPSLQEFIREEIERVSNISVPLGAENVFCLDNEAFRYLVLKKNLQKDKEALFQETTEHHNFVRSWNISKKASENMIAKASSLPVLDIREVVNYNQSRTMSIDLAKEIVQTLINIFKTDPTQSSLPKISQDIIEKAASITKHLSSKAVTIFNDHLDAHLEETSKAYLTSPVEGHSNICHLLEQVRSNYRDNIKKEPSIDEMISKLRELLKRACADRLSC